MNTGLLERAPTLELDRPVCSFIDIERLGGLASLRANFRLQAKDILDANSNNLESAPLPTDVLAPIKELKAIEATYGIDSPQYKQKRYAVDQSNSRLVGEVESANEAEYFPSVHYDRDPSNGQYSVNGELVIGTVANGLSPLARIEEQAIRIDDVVEELSYVAIGGSGISTREHSIIGIKECPDYARTEYVNGNYSQDFGYVPRVNKLAIGDEKFGADNRSHEQFMLPGTYYDHDLIVETAQEIGLLGPGENLTAAELRGRQYLSDSKNAALHFIKRLDEKASLKYGLNIFMGQVVPEDHPKDYDAFKDEAEKRQETRIEKGAKVTDFLITLNDHGLDSAVAERRLNRFLSDCYITESIDDPEVAKRVFDQATTSLIEDIHNLNIQGRHEEAAQVEKFLREVLPPVTYCGAGSCGLETATVADAAKARALGLKGDILEDTVRKCGCGGLAYYDMEGNKACIKCNRREIDKVTSYKKDDDEAEGKPKAKDKHIRWLF